MADPVWPNGCYGVLRARWYSKNSTKIDSSEQNIVNLDIRFMSFV